jgi:anti-sigma regulatory factor (Ser/Thr protein kinase)
MRCAAAVAAHAAEAGLSRQRVYDVAAAAHELAANAVRHGAGHGRLRLWADGSSLRCQVSDDGPAEQDETRPDPAAWQRSTRTDCGSSTRSPTRSPWTTTPAALR